MRVGALVNFFVGVWVGFSILTPAPGFSHDVEGGSLRVSLEDVVEVLLSLTVVSEDSEIGDLEVQSDGALAEVLMISSRGILEETGTEINRVRELRAWLDSGSVEVVQ